MSGAFRPEPALKECELRDGRFQGGDAQGGQGLPEDLPVLCLDLEWIEGLDAVLQRIASLTGEEPA